MRKKDSIYAIMAGIFATLLVLFLFFELVSPSNVSLFMIPASVLLVFLWLNAWRVARKRQDAAAQAETLNEKPR